MAHPGITSSSPVQGVWSAVTKQAVAVWKQDTGRSHTHGNALAQSFSMTVLDVALPQEDLPVPRMGGFKFF